MLKAFVEQKGAVDKALGRKEAKNAPQMLDDEEVNLLAVVSKYLEPFLDISAKVCEDDATASLFLPLLALLAALLKQMLTTERSAMAKQFGRTLMQSLRESSRKPSSNGFLKAVMAVDPRFYRWGALLNDDEWDDVELAIIEQHSVERLPDLVTDTEPAAVLSDEEDDAQQSPWNLLEKKRKIEKKRGASAAEIAKAKLLAAGRAEFAHFANLLETERPAKDADPFEFWRKNEKTLPMIAKAARRYLAAPPTSVASERLFSQAGLIYDNKLRTRLLP